MIKYISSFVIIFLLLIAGKGFTATFHVSNTPELRRALVDASGNGKDDTILLNAGIYKTTDDGTGTFKFIDIEPYNLVIKSKEGLNRKDVILDGGHVDRVFTFRNPQCPACTITLERLSIINGRSGGLESDYNINILSSSIINKAGGQGLTSRGGVAATGSIIIE